MPILIVVLGIGLLLFLITVIKLNSFIAFVFVALAIALVEGMPVDMAVKSIEKGIGSTMGYIVMILCFGAMLGKLVSESGAAQRITLGMIRVFGKKYIQFALMFTGFIVGISLFYDVGFFIMIPLVFTIAASAGLPLLYVGLPMLASLSVTHGFLPPHPAPSAIAAMFEADPGKTMVYGIIIALPVIFLSGPLLARALSRIEAKPLKEFINPNVLAESELPGFGISLFSALMPMILISSWTLTRYFLQDGNILYNFLAFLGNPPVSMMISVLFASYTLGVARGRKLAEIMSSLTHSVISITVIMLLIAGAGALKQVLVDSGVSNYIGELLKSSNLSPLFLGWLIATVLRFCIGSATVAGITAAGIVLPLLAVSGVNRELMVIAIGSGSLMFGHVNDGGFWLFKEYFNLSIKDTLKTWSVMETSIGVTGLLGVMLLDFFV